MSPSSIWSLGQLQEKVYITTVSAWGPVPPAGVNSQNTQGSERETPSSPHLSLPLRMGCADATGERFLAEGAVWGGL